MEIIFSRVSTEVVKTTTEFLVCLILLELRCDRDRGEITGKKDSERRAECVCEIECVRERECVCVWKRERERECDRVCEIECVRER